MQYYQKPEPRIPGADSDVGSDYEPPKSSGEITFMISTNTMHYVPMITYFIT